MGETEGFMARPAGFVLVRAEPKVQSFYGELDANRRACSSSGRPGLSARPQIVSSEP